MRYSHRHGLERSVKARYAGYIEDNTSRPNRTWYHITHLQADLSRPVILTKRRLLRHLELKQHPRLRSLCVTTGTCWGGSTFLTQSLSTFHVAVLHNRKRGWPLRWDILRFDWVNTLAPCYTTPIGSWIHLSTPIQKNTLHHFQATSTSQHRRMASISSPYVKRVKNVTGYVSFHDHNAMTIDSCNSIKETSASSNMKSPQPQVFMVNRYEKAKQIFAKYNLDFDETEWPEDRRQPVERVQKPIRMRIRYTCHKCQNTYGGSKICSLCDHMRCKECVRYPAKKKTKTAKTYAAPVDPMKAAPKPGEFKPRVAGEERVYRETSMRKSSDQTKTQKNQVPPTDEDTRPQPMASGSNSAVEAVTGQEFVQDTTEGAEPGLADKVKGMAISWSGLLVQCFMLVWTWITWEVDILTSSKNLFITVVGYAMLQQRFERFIEGPPEVLDRLCVYTWVSWSLLLHDTLRLSALAVAETGEHAPIMKIMTITYLPYSTDFVTGITFAWIFREPAKWTRRY